MKKTGLAVLTAMAICTAGVMPTTSFAAEKNTSVVQQKAAIKSINLSELNSNYQVTNAKQNGLIRTVTYAKNNEKHVVVFNGNTGQVKIDNVVQKDLSYEYDPQKATAATAKTSYSASSTVTTMAAAPKSGYKYVGSISGHTKEAKSAAKLATQLIGVIPGLGWGTKAVLILTGYKAEDSIPSLYYKYDLYQKGFMTNNWYQYTTTRFYKDSAHKKAIGKPWTSSPQKIDLPNS